MDWSIFIMLSSAAVSVLGGITSLMGAGASRKKNNAETEATLSQTAMELVAPLRAQILEVQKDNFALRQELAQEKLDRTKESAELRSQISQRDSRIIEMQSQAQQQSARIDRLEGQVRMLGATPIP